MPSYYEDYGDFLFEFAINLPDQAQANYLNDAINTYANAVKVNNNHSNVLMNQGLAYTRLADLYRNDAQEYEKYKFLSLEVMKAANDKMRNNPFYPYKFGITLKFYKQYKDALGQFLIVNEIRNPYRDTQRLINELKPLFPLEETSDESSDGDSEE